MSRVAAAETIDATPELIWELLVDPARFPDWQVTTLAVKDAEDRVDRVGATFTAISGLTARSFAPKGGERATSAWDARVDPTASRTRGWFQWFWQVTRVTPPTLLEFTGHAPGGAHGSIVQTLTPSEAATEYSVVNEYELPAGFVGAVADRVFVARMLQRNIIESARRLKAIAEAEK